MCFREFISYQCAHRSPPVLRTCAMTTEAHSNPVCDKRPDRQYIADTGCTVCERCHHGRWVMIREREHRWMHERGACGCDVVFHGLLNTPQVSGLDASFPISDESRLLGFGVEESEFQETKGKEKATMKKASVPPLYTEINTAEGRSVVQLRIKSLYAGEWRDDHRALHEAGKCNCHAVFAPVKPMIPDEDLTPEERKMVESWRDQANAAESQGKEVKPYEDGYETEDAVSDRRLREIQETFGGFQVKANEDTTPPQMSSGKISHTAEPSEQGYRRMGRRNAHPKSQPPFQRRNLGGKRRGGKDQARERSQTHPLAQHATQANSGYPSQSGSGAPTSIALASQGWVYDPFTNQMTMLTHGQNASPSAPGVYNSSAQLPQLSQAAHPAFPTTALGPSPWVQEHTQVQQKAEPFRCSPGFDYSSIDDPNYVDVVGTPICGIPIGGEAHMPTWSECVLRNPEASPVESSPYTVIEEASHVEAETGPYIVVGYNSNSADSKSDAGYGTTDDDSAIADGDLLGPGGSPTSQRRHSA
ncbi:hypothetical protein QBC40DRAFT_332790, partial [Triangularia verruculosa]